MAPGRRRAAAGREALTLSINLSARSLGQPDMVTQMHCQRAGMVAARLVIELTETAAMG